MVTSTVILSLLTTVIGYVVAVPAGAAPAAALVLRGGDPPAELRDR